MSFFGVSKENELAIFAHGEKSSQYNHYSNQSNDTEDEEMAIKELYREELQLQTKDDNDGVSSYSPEDDESSFGTEVSIPPPPPPVTMRERARRLFECTSLSRKSPQPTGTSTTVGRNSQSTPKSNQNREAWIIEQGDDQAIESVDMSAWPSHWNSLGTKSSQGMKSQLRKQIWLLVLLVLLLGVVLALVLGLSKDDKSSNIGSNQLSSGSTSDKVDSVAEKNDNLDLIEADIESDTTSFDDLVDTPTEPTTGADGIAPAGQGGGADDTATNTPLDEEPVAAETLPDTPFCNDLLQMPSTCFELANLANTPFLLTFNRCNPDAENWIGIYEDSASSDSLPDPIEWLWTCNSQDLADCNNEGTNFGLLPFGSTLTTGTYRAHLISQDGAAPFVSILESATFEVREVC